MPLSRSRNPSISILFALAAFVSGVLAQIPPLPSEPNGGSYYITPTRIPTDMYYKPPSIGGSPTWYTYGNPGYDKTGGRGDWTYIVWSCVQQGNGAAYPKNITRGGGLVRALGKRDALFNPCRVAPIVGISYGPGDRQNGVVTGVSNRQTDWLRWNKWPVFIR